jgi:hypothetical protein
MMEEEKRYWIRREEAGRLTESITDYRVRCFVRYGIALLLTRRGMREASLPQSPVDLYHFVEVLKALAEHREDLLEILAGDPSKFEWD